MTPCVQHDTSCSIPDHGTYALSALLDGDGEEQKEITLRILGLLTRESVIVALRSLLSDLHKCRDSPCRRRESVVNFSFLTPRTVTRKENIAQQDREVMTQYLFMKQEQVTGLKDFVQQWVSLKIDHDRALRERDAAVVDVRQLRHQLSRFEGAIQALTHIPEVSGLAHLFSEMRTLLNSTSSSSTSNTSNTNTTTTTTSTNTTNTNNTNTNSNNNNTIPSDPPTTLAKHRPIAHSGIASPSPSPSPSPSHLAAIHHSKTASCSSLPSPSSSSCLHHHRSCHCDSKMTGAVGVAKERRNSLGLVSRSRSASPSVTHSSSRRSSIIDHSPSPSPAVERVVIPLARVQAARELVRRARSSAGAVTSEELADTLSGLADDADKLAGAVEEGERSYGPLRERLRLYENDSADADGATSQSASTRRNSLSPRSFSMEERGRLLQQKNALHASLTALRKDKDSAMRAAQEDKARYKQLSKALERERERVAELIKDKNAMTKRIDALTLSRCPSCVAMDAIPAPPLVSCCHSSSKRSTSFMNSSPSAAAESPTHQQQQHADWRYLTSVAALRKTLESMEKEKDRAEHNLRHEQLRVRELEKIIANRAGLHKLVQELNSREQSRSSSRATSRCTSPRGPSEQYQFLQNFSHAIADGALSSQSGGGRPKSPVETQALLLARRAMERSRSSRSHTYPERNASDVSIASVASATSSSLPSPRGSNASAGATATGGNGNAALDQIPEGVRESLAVLSREELEQRLVMAEKLSSNLSSANTSPLRACDCKRKKHRLERAEKEMKGLLKRVAELLEDAEAEVLFPTLPQSIDSCESESVINNNNNPLATSPTYDTLISTTSSSPKGFTTVASSSLRRKVPPLPIPKSETPRMTLLTRGGGSGGGGGKASIATLRKSIEELNAAATILSENELRSPPTVLSKHDLELRSPVKFDNDALDYLRSPSEQGEKPRSPWEDPRSPNGDYVRLRSPSEELRSLKRPPSEEGKYITTERPPRCNDKLVQDEDQEEEEDENEVLLEEDVLLSNRCGA